MVARGASVVFGSGDGEWCGAFVVFGSGKGKWHDAFAVFRSDDGEWCGASVVFGSGNGEWRRAPVVFGSGDGEWHGVAATFGSGDGEWHRVVMWRVVVAESLSVNFGCGLLVDAIQRPPTRRCNRCWCSWLAWRVDLWLVLGGVWCSVVGMAVGARQLVAR